MKKIYLLALSFVATISYGQTTHLNDAFNYTDNSLLTSNGWTAHSGAGSQSIDVGASNGISYSGYNTGVGSTTGQTVGNAAKLDNTGEDVNQAFSSPVTTGSTIYMSFLLNVSNATTGYFLHLSPTATATQVCRIFVRPSTTTPATKFNIGASNTGTAVYGTSELDLNTPYLVIVKYDNTTTGAISVWVKSTGIPTSEAAAGTAEITTSGSGNATVDRVCLRQFSATQNETIDGLFVSSTWLGTTPCSLSLGTENSVCNAITLNIDTWTTTIPFTGGGTGSYTITPSSGTVGGDNPNSVASGNIIISGINEGVTLSVNITGTCSVSKTISSPNCKPINTLPYYEPFNYTIGNVLTSEQKWTNVNTGDDILVATGNLSYSGVTPLGNSITWNGAGTEARTPFTSTNTGTVYSSFLFSATDLSNITVDLTNTYFALFTDDTGSSTNARVWVRKNGTQYQFGLGSGTAPDTWSTNLYNPGEVQYLVFGYDFTNNLFVLYENQATPSTPSISVTPSAALANVGGFMLRQDAANTTPNIVFDELKISTSLPTLSTKDFNNISGLKMYPNPAKNVLNIASDSFAPKNVEIYTMLGKKVLASEVVNGSVNISALAKGIYVIKIKEEDKTATRELVVE